MGEINGSWWLCFNFSEFTVFQSVWGYFTFLLPSFFKCSNIFLSAHIFFLIAWLCLLIFLLFDFFFFGKVYLRLVNVWMILDIFCLLAICLSLEKSLFRSVHALCSLVVTMNSKSSLRILNTRPILMHVLEVIFSQNYRLAWKQIWCSESWSCLVKGIVGTSNGKAVRWGSQ